MNKEEYYTYLKKCKVIFSANKHENLGIGTFEAVRSGCLPLLPKKLSYEEMYDNEFLYRCNDTIYTNPEKWMNILGKEVCHFIDNYTNIVHNSKYTDMVNRIQEKFFSSTKIISTIKGRSYDKSMETV